MLTMDEARGIAAGIWCRTNNKRKVMDPQLCEDIADVLVDEVCKRSLDDTATPKLKELQDQNEQLKTEILNLRSINEKAELQTQLVKEQALKDQAAIQTHQKDLEHVNGNLRHELKQASVEVANLKSELDTLKLVPKNEVV